MKNRTLPITLGVTLAPSIFLNFRMAGTAESLHADSYEILYEQHPLNARLIGQLEAGKVGTALALLQREIDTRGPIVAIYLMEHCSGKHESEPNDICREHTTP